MNVMLNLLVSEEILFMNNAGDKNKSENNKDKSSRSEIFWDLFLTGGLFSIQKEWRNSKSPLHTFLLFFLPIFGAGILILIVILVYKIFK
jgi:hypothetical protein